MPCWELFDEQDEAYRDSVLPPAVTARVAVEAGVEQGWEKYLGPAGPLRRHDRLRRLGPRRRAVYKHFGFTAENVVAQAKALLGREVAGHAVSKRRTSTAARICERRLSRRHVHQPPERFGRIEAEGVFARGQDAFGPQGAGDLLALGRAVARAAVGDERLQGLVGAR